MATDVLETVYAPSYVNLMVIFHHAFSSVKAQQEVGFIGKFPVCKAGAGAEASHQLTTNYVRLFNSRLLKKQRNSH